MTDNRITVTGHAQVHVAPTVATWHLTTEVTDREARVAYERCAEQATSIIARLKASAEIETQQITVEPAREFESSTARLVGHQASTIVTARAPVEQAGEIADLGRQSGATETHGPQLDALEQALADARRRAKRLAAAARRALGPIVSI